MNTNVFREFAKSAIETALNSSDTCENQIAKLANETFSPAYEILEEVLNSGHGIQYFRQRITALLSQKGNDLNQRLPAYEGNLKVLKLIGEQKAGSMESKAEASATAFMQLAFDREEVKENNLQQRVLREDNTGGLSQISETPVIFSGGENPLVAPNKRDRLGVPYGQGEGAEDTQLVRHSAPQVAEEKCEETLLEFEQRQRRDRLARTQPAYEKERAEYLASKNKSKETK